MKVVKQNGDYVSYLYDAAGIKLKKTARTGNSNPVITDYVAGGSAFRKHYVDEGTGSGSELSFFQHAEGRCPTRE